MRGVPFQSGSPVDVDGTITDAKLTQLLDLGHEYEDLDYKSRLDLRSKSKRAEVDFVKDVAAFQVLGGYIVLGADDHGKLTGGMDDVDLRPFEHASLVSKLESYVPGPLTLTSRVFERDGHKVVLICVHRSPRGFAILKRDGGYEGGQAFREGEIYYRKGTSNKLIPFDVLDKIIKWRIDMGITEEALQEPLAAAIERFIREGPPRGLQPRTISDYRGVLKKLANRYPDSLVPDFDARNEGTNTLVRFIEDEWGRRAAAIQQKRVLKIFFGWCYEQGLVRSDPGKGLRIPKPKRRARRVPTEQQVDALIAAQDRVPDRIALALIGRVGLSKSEVRLARYGDFNVKSKTGTVHVRTEGGKEREASFDDSELLADLRRLLIDEKRPHREYMLHPRPVGNLKGQPPDIVPEKWNKPMHSTTMHHWFKRCIARAEGLTDFTIDGLRLAGARRNAETA
jgi:integrase